MAGLYQLPDSSRGFTFSLSSVAIGAAPIRFSSQNRFSCWPGDRRQAVHDGVHHPTLLPCDGHTILSYPPGLLVEEGQFMFVAEENEFLAFDEDTISECEKLVAAFGVRQVRLERGKTAERFTGRATKDRVPVIFQPVFRDS